MKTIRAAPFMLALSTLTLTPALQASSVQAAEVRIPRYMLQLDASAITARVTLNGILIEDWRDPQWKSKGMVLNGWLKPGANTLELDIRPAPGSKEDLRVGVEVGTETKTLFKLDNWEEEVTLPYRKTVTLTTPATYPILPLWKAEPVAIGESERRAVLDTVLQLHQDYVSAATSRNVDRLVALMLAKSAPTLAALGATETPAELAEEVRMSLEEGQPAPRIVASLSSSDLLLQDLGGGRVRVSRKDGRPVTRVLLGEFMAIGLNSPVLGRLGGKWQVLQDTL